MNNFFGAHRAKSSYNYKQSKHLSRNRKNLNYCNDEC